MSDSGTEGTDEDELPPAEAFSLLGDDVRIEIIAVLGEASEQRLSFSELHDRVGLADSGQFNYHLSKLVSHFVSKTDEGYRLTAAGERLARAIAAGLYTDSPELEPFPVEGTCVECGAESLDAAYADERFTVICRECSHRQLGVRAPPSLVRERSPREALDAFEEWSHSQVRQAHAGLCPSCGGPVERGLTRDVPSGLPFDVLPSMTCRICDRKVVTTFAAVARLDDTVEAFLEHEGLDPQPSHYWNLDEYISDDSLELLSESPFRMQVTFAGPERRCDVVIDDALEVVRTTVRNEKE